VFPWSFVVARDSGLLSYGPDMAAMLHRSASYVDRILRGGKPADLPVQAPVKYELVINVTPAKTIGLTIPAEFLLRADKAIE
jgi:putative ABC transport system substrate-binding protein